MHSWKLTLLRLKTLFHPKTINCYPRKWNQNLQQIDFSVGAIQFKLTSKPSISLSLEYHMESIFGNTIALNNIPQIRYLQAPAAFKVAHLKKFLSSKYDLHHLKKSMNVDIIYEGEVLSDEFSLMDIAYAYCWERVSITRVCEIFGSAKRFRGWSDWCLATVSEKKKCIFNLPKKI